MKKILAALAMGATLAAGASAAIKPAAEDPLVRLDTSKGDILIRVYKKEAPVTAGNFLGLVRSGFYKNMIFHRVEPGFVVQTGDPQGTGQGGSGKNIKLETSPQLKHDSAGVVAMARTPDPNSASSQFYITMAPTPFLDPGVNGPGYAIFGHVEKGMDVVNKIQVGDKFISASVIGAPAIKGKPAPKKVKPGVRAHAAAKAPAKKVKK